MAEILEEIDIGGYLTAVRQAGYWDIEKWWKSERSVDPCGSGYSGYMAYDRNIFRIDIC